ncbi:MAG: DUF1638 domain-containing protein [Bryobacteraceae bacterium]
MRLKLIGCEVLHRELCAVVARSVNQVDMELLPKGLHDLASASMLARLQQAVDGVESAAYEAVVLGYALCGNGLVGLRARFLPLVVPRAHDCITLLLGSKERYLDYFQSHPGVYFRSTGWIERAGAHDSQLSLEYDDLVERYGEDSARYLRRELTRHYRQLTFIEMGVEPDNSFEQRSRAEAAERGWTFERVDGDMRLIRRLVDGPWDERDFLVVRPGFRVAARHDDGIIQAEPA